jgi:hypothetical protein
MVLSTPFDTLLPLFIQYGDSVTINAQYLGLSMDTLTTVEFYCQIEPEDKWYRMRLPRDWSADNWHAYANIVRMFEHLSCACEELGFQQRGE